MTGELRMSNTEQAATNPVGLAWREDGAMHVLQRVPTADRVMAPNRAFLLMNAGHWWLDIWDDSTTSWVRQETTYDDLETAKAVAVALEIGRAHV